MNFLAYLEASVFSEWVLTSMLGFPTLIALHSVGMAVAVGLSIIVTLYLNNIVTGISVVLIPRLLGIAVWGFILNFITGVVLFISRGPEYMQSVIFLIKLLLVVVSATILFWLKYRMTSSVSTPEIVEIDTMAKRLSLLFAVTWVGAVVAGRLIAYLSDIY